MTKELPQNLKLRFPEYCAGCTVGDYEINNSLYMNGRPTYTLYCTHQRACSDMRQKVAEKTTPIVN